MTPLPARQQYKAWLQAWRILRARRPQLRARRPTLRDIWTHSDIARGRRLGLELMAKIKWD